MYIGVFLNTKDAFRLISFWLSLKPIPKSPVLRNTHMGMCQKKGTPLEWTHQLCWASAFGLGEFPAHCALVGFCSSFSFLSQKNPLKHLKGYWICVLSSLILFHELHVVFLLIAEFSPWQVVHLPFLQIFPVPFSSSIGSAVCFLFLGRAWAYTLVWAADLGVWPGSRFFHMVTNWVDMKRTYRSFWCPNRSGTNHIPKRADKGASGTACLWMLLVFPLHTSWQMQAKPR